MKEKISRNLQNYDVLWCPKDNSVYLIEGRHIVSEEKTPAIYSGRYERMDEPYSNMIYLVLHDTVDNHVVVSGLMGEDKSNCWVNKKNLNYYKVVGLVVDATNKSDGQIKVMYTRCGSTYVRDIYEFLEKFIPRFKELSTIEVDEIIPFYSKAKKEIVEVR